MSTRRVTVKLRGIEAVGILRGLAQFEVSSYIDADPCVYCGGKSGTKEHILPRNRGGVGLGWENLASACQACNMKRGSRPLLIYLLERSHP